MCENVYWLLINKAWESHPAARRFQLNVHLVSMGSLLFSECVFFVASEEGIPTFSGTYITSKFWPIATWLRLFLDINTRLNRLVKSVLSFGVGAYYFKRNEYYKYDFFYTFATLLLLTLIFNRLY